MAEHGPLSGVKVVEIQGLGPTPFAAMWLADMGADVVRIERPNLKPLIPQKVDVLNRGRGFVALDLKVEADREQARALIREADMLIEGMRPGVMERLGLGPDDFPENPKLVFGRMTGWGQTGPLAHTAGHDINYISITGALHAIGGTHPVPPLNLLGDFGGGAMYLVAGMLAALHAAKETGKGQVVDCAITDGTTHLMAMTYSLYGSGLWVDEREKNLLDGGAPYYTIYQCACGGHMSVGALEAKFYAELLDRIGLADADLPRQMDVSGWPELRTALAKKFGEKSRDEWASILEGSDACAAPVLSMEEASQHPHNQARAAFIKLSEVTQPAAAPQLADTPGEAKVGEENTPQPVGDVLARWRR
ncbi:CaiB/BaiF CoA-transferase family protein [Aliiroseovarius sp. KMU-50]|uniref:CaiB/BaiF CoA-transferase family protein n=1 Tax=Aliiroseovarius salicola TaxID=3009082 RepID=A0ABT4W4H5_9RHOB|nr:CaiB/BaiF CoA-transferase family protein [Aliiroseovarius sp. KMU-50]MDA5095375.1 CaiB/BaiF CoA-transferase family protein [Aliiroseovarius sp. KMU-50]